jgi:ubiquinone/menaquinone biosynthesis C-methylase UbiE
MNEDYHNYNNRRFKKAALVYDLTFLPIRGIRKKVFEMAEAGQNGQVLDIGTGTGAQILEFAGHVKRGVGADISEAMLEAADKKNTDPSIRFIRADASALPFGDGEFDIAILSFCLHEMPAPIREKAVREAMRTTRAGGRIIIVDYINQADYPGSRLVKFFGYLFLRFYECRYFREFVQSDFYRELEKKGLAKVRQASYALGFFVIMVYEKKEKSS